MKIYHFKLELVGHADTPERAWVDAVENFIQDPGPLLESTEYTVEDDQI